MFNQSWASVGRGFAPRSNSAGARLSHSAPRRPSPRARPVIFMPRRGIRARRSACPTHGSARRDARSAIRTPRLAYRAPADRSLTPRPYENARLCTSLPQHRCFQHTLEVGVVAVPRPPTPVPMAGFSFGSGCVRCFHQLARQPIAPVLQACRGGGAQRRGRAHPAGPGPGQPGARRPSRWAQAAHAPQIPPQHQEAARACSSDGLNLRSAAPNAMAAAVTSGKRSKLKRTHSSAASRNSGESTGAVCDSTSVTNGTK